MIYTSLFDHHYIPAKQASDRLIIVFHGKGDSFIPFLEFQSETQLFDFHFLLLNAPKKYLDGFSWYGDPPYQRKGVEKMRRMLFSLMNDLEDQGWESEKIILFGFSQGCLICTDLALHYPKRFMAVIGISGYFHFSPRWRKQINEISKSTPWLMSHGNKDDILPIEDTFYGVNKLRNLGLQIDWIESDKKHSLEEFEYPLLKTWIQERSH